MQRSRAPTLGNAVTLSFRTRSAQHWQSRPREQTKLQCGLEASRPSPVARRGSGGSGGRPVRSVLSVEQAGTSCWRLKGLCTPPVSLLPTLAPSACMGCEVAKLGLRKREVLGEGTFKISQFSLSVQP